MNDKLNIYVISRYDDALGRNAPVFYCYSQEAAEKECLRLGADGHWGTWVEVPYVYG